MQTRASKEIVVIKRLVVPAVAAAIVCAVAVAASVYAGVSFSFVNVSPSGASEVGDRADQNGADLASPSSESESASCAACCPDCPDCPCCPACCVSGSKAQASIQGTAAKSDCCGKGESYTISRKTGR